MHRFHFSSVLKRMSTIVETEGDAGTRCVWERPWLRRRLRPRACLRQRPYPPSPPPAPSPPLRSWWVLSKGAPEVVLGLLAAVPPHYERVYKRYASEGARVLAMGYRQLDSLMTPSELRHLPRDAAEAGLTFAGFAVFRSPLKHDSEPALRMLRESQHQLIMITGGCPALLRMSACRRACRMPWWQHRPPPHRGPQVTRRSRRATPPRKCTSSRGPPWSSPSEKGFEFPLCGQLPSILALHCICTRAPASPR